MKSSKRILVVEDEALIAMLLEEMLADLDHVCTGVAATLTQALDMARTTDADAVILDLSLGGDKSLSVADLLEERGIPYIFASGYGSSALEPPYDSRYVLQKPFQMEELEQALSAL